jgi:hypothetical protein
VAPQPEGRGFAGEFCGRDHGPGFSASSAGELLHAAYGEPRTRPRLRRIDEPVPERWPQGLRLPGNAYAHGRQGWVWQQRIAPPDGAPQRLRTPFVSLDCSVLVDRPAAEVWQFFAGQLGLSPQQAALYFDTHQAPATDGEPAEVGCLLRTGRVLRRLGCQELALDLHWFDPAGYCAVDIELALLPE